MNIPVTEWFTGVNPTIHGAYEAYVAVEDIEKEYSEFPNCMRYWNGEYWSRCWQGTIQPSLETVRHNPGNVTWRGLTSPHPEWKP